MARTVNPSWYTNTTNQLNAQLKEAFGPDSSAEYGLDGRVHSMTVTVPDTLGDVQVAKVVRKALPFRFGWHSASNKAGKRTIVWACDLGPAPAPKEKKVKAPKEKKVKATQPVSEAKAPEAPKVKSNAPSKNEARNARRREARAAKKATQPQG